MKISHNPQCIDIRSEEERVNYNALLSSCYFDTLTSNDKIIVIVVFYKDRILVKV